MHQLWLLTALLALTGCSSMTKMALRSQAPLFEGGSKTLEEERSWEWFREATPGNIQFMETMLGQDPENHILRRTLIKAYAGYGYGVFETLALREQILSLEEREFEGRARDMYRRALAHGEIYFGQKGVRFQVNDEEALQKSLKKNLSKDDFVSLIYFAQAWGGLINLQKSDMGLVSQVPKVKLLFDFVCKQVPDIEQGVCALFYAQYEASRPRMLGGNPELGKTLFEKFIEKFPEHQLARLNYLQFSVLPRMDEEAFGQVEKELERGFAAWETGSGAKRLNLYNAIAKKRWDIIKSNKKSLF